MAVGAVAPVDEVLEHQAVLLADGVDEVAVAPGDVHVPGAAAVPVEEVDGFLKLPLRGGERGLEVSAESGEGHPPVPFATGGQREGESAILEVLPAVHHEALRLGLLQHGLQESVVTGFHAQGMVHLAGVVKFFVRIENIVHRPPEVVDAVGFGDDGIHQRSEPEGLLAVAVLDVRVQQVLQFGEVAVGDFGAVVIGIHFNEE